MGKIRLGLGARGMRSDRGEKSRDRDQEERHAGVVSRKLWRYRSRGIQLVRNYHEK